jgi:hypothetical protein
MKTLPARFFFSGLVDEGPQRGLSFPCVFHVGRSTKEEEEASILEHFKFRRNFLNCFFLVFFRPFYRENNVLGKSSFIFHYFLDNSILVLFKDYLKMTFMTFFKTFI